MSRIDVALVNPPFWPATHSSLALGLLQGGLEARGYRVQQFNLYLDVVETFGIDKYFEMGEFPGVSFFLGDWVFSEAVFGANSAREAAFSDYTSSPNRSDRHVTPLPLTIFDTAKALRAEVPVLIDGWVDTLLSSGAQIFGFSNVFQQTLAGVAIAQALKARAPDVLTVFGGANCEGPAGRALVKAFDCIDVVVNGEGDLVLPEIVARFAADGKAGIAQLPGCIMLGQEAQRKVPAQAVQCLDDIPEPVYRDLYEDISRREFDSSFALNLVFETSRGCWWGAKHHCTFCGINTERMKFRSKSPELALAQLQRAVNDYQPKRIFTSDNIMDVKYLETFVPMLADAKLNLDIYYELKSNLKRKYLGDFRRAGILSIQPGIEALDDEILALVDKGASAVQHLRLLKWCDEEAIECNWNLLYGFPGESEAAYERTLTLLPLLMHLPPPSDFIRFVLLRFSPYFERPQNYNIRNITPDPAYGHIFDLDDDALFDLAYYFCFEHGNGDSDRISQIFAKITGEIALWKDSYHCTSLISGELEYGEMFILDTRDCATRERHRLDPILAKVARTTREGCSRTKLVSILSGTLSVDEIDTAIACLTSAKLLASVSDQHVFLPVESEVYAIGGRQAMPAIRKFKRDAFLVEFAAASEIPLTFLGEDMSA